MQIGVIHRHRFDLLSERLAEREGGSETGERLRATVDTTDNPVGGVVPKWMGVADHQRIDSNPAGHPVRHAADLAVLDGAHTECAHDHQVIVRSGNVLHQALPVLAIEGLVFERQAGLLARGFHDVQVRVGNQLEAPRDQRIVDLALALEFLLVLVLLGQGVLHLLEAHVVHSRCIDVTPGEAGLKGLSQPDADVDGRVGMVGVINWHIYPLIHQRSPSRGPSLPTT